MSDGLTVLCACGCGQETRLATQTDGRAGRVKGQPTRFLKGHSGGRVRQDFWAKVQKTGGCWLWLGSRDKNGYGQTHDDSGHPWLAHRLAYALATGRLPTSHVLHNCDVPACVRPDHLFEWTNTDNIRDCMEKGRLPQGENMWNARLTTEQVREIRRRCASGETQRRVATSYGLCQQHISDIIRRHLWKTV